MKTNSTNEEFVLVFRTNIHRKKDVKSLTPLLNGCSEIIKWNIDLADCDNVLRIEATHPNHEPVIHLVKKAGYNCEELTD
ncbi:hypothetical protein LXM25_12595 [Dyadobacter sp. LJ53]|uniref:hypothetical protein n=1 Tax=Dyadobacter chenwenxiniae TaxID=2906456 RepID=UPI001F258A9F|nr:hypothetical protein [Dyadobacter chenwenxiniae]MCF0050904.1 hypothetical protein [Dyadobacter chenwenxiniae]